MLIVVTPLSRITFPSDKKEVGISEFVYNEEGKLLSSNFVYTDKKYPYSSLSNYKYDGIGNISEIEDIVSFGTPENLTKGVRFEVSKQDLSYPMSRMPTLPRICFIMQGVRKTNATVLVEQVPALGVFNRIVLGSKTLAERIII